MIIIPDAMRRPAEAERDELKKQLAEARAEIERLKNQLEDESTRADGMTTAYAEAGAKNYRQQELIEQMREALEMADALIHRLLMGADYAQKECEEIRAAIRAAKGEV